MGPVMPYLLAQGGGYCSHVRGDDFFGYGGSGGRIVVILTDPPAAISADYLSVRGGVNINSHFRRSLACQNGGSGTVFVRALYNNLTVSNDFFLTDNPTVIQDFSLPEYVTDTTSKYV
jgi:hypothetical protein